MEYAPGRFRGTRFRYSAIDVIQGKGVKAVTDKTLQVSETKEMHSGIRAPGAVIGWVTLTHQCTDFKGHPRLMLVVPKDR